MPDNNSPFTAPINADAQRLSDAPAKEPVQIEGTKATAATNLWGGSPQDRFAEQQRERERLDPHMDHSLVQKRDAAGNITFHEKIVDPKTGEISVGKLVHGEQGDAPIAGEPDAEGRKTAPAAGDDQKIRVGDVEYTQAELREMAAFKAESDLRKAQVPATPRDYKIELPKDFVFPPGVEFKFAAEDDTIKGAGLQAAREWAHKQGFSQGQFSQMLSVYATAQSNEALMIGRAAAREREALGVNGASRVNAIALWLKAHYPEALRPVLATLATKSQVEMFEDMIGRRINSGGGSNFSARREPPSTGISDAEYEAMSYGQKVAYAQQATARAQSSGRR
jgi:hypothetical protein